MKIKKCDVVDFLDRDEAIIEYLNAALEEGDSDFFVKAVGDVGPCQRYDESCQIHRLRQAKPVPVSVRRGQPAD